MPHPSEQHAQHDHLLVVSLAAGDLTAADRDRGASQIATCTECALLHDDLLAIARATAVLPAAVRPRDFQLTPEQAARLRPGGWRRFIAAFASPRLAVTRQLGVGLTTLGIAGLLVSTLGSINLSMGSAAGAPAAADQRELMSTDESGGGPQPAASAAAASAAPAAAAASGGAASGAPLYGAEASGSADGGTVLLPDLSAGPLPTSTNGRGTIGVAQAPPAATRATPVTEVNRDAVKQLPADGPGVPLIVIASAILLAAGIALLLARRVARRITTD